MAECPPRLVELLKKTQGLIGGNRSHFDGGTVFTVEELIRSAISMDENRERRVQLSFLLTEFREFYRSMASTKAAADAQVLLEEMPAAAFLTLVPAHPGGKDAGGNEIRRAIQLSGVSFGLNYSAIEAAAEKFSKKEETIYGLPIAQGEPSEKGEDASVEFAVRVFDKSRIFGSDPSSYQDLPSRIEPVVAGQLLGRICPPGAGRAGRGIRGQELKPIRGNELEWAFGEGIACAPGTGEVRASCAGAVVCEGHRADVVPFYVVSGELRSGQDVTFAGNVLVAGPVLGPVTIRAEDIYVVGNVEDAEVHSSGDVWVGGTVSGKRQGVIEVDGRLHARTINHGVVVAFGDVVVRHSIAYSDVTSNGRVVVAEERGAIVGGQIAALREIVARHIGSDFATETSTTVGCDFLTPRRLEKIEERIREHEQNLAKIDLLKRKLAEAHVDIAKLAPDKQDMYIAVLQKEKKAREGLASLRRGRERFAQAMREFLQATIRVLEELHPPVKVRIGQTVREFQERLERVTLVLESGNRISARKEP